MSKYFDYFKKVNYPNSTLGRYSPAVNITLRAKILDELNNDPYAFLPYTINAEERAEDIAYYYYNGVEYIWLVYFSANIIDPYHDWPMPGKIFKEYLNSKYGALAEADGFTGGGYFWSQNEGTSNNIVYYQNIEDSSITISKDTYDYEPSIVGGEWTAIRYFDMENTRNEEKRNIQLLNNVYVKVAEKNLRRLLAE